jgi:hypothetical protein
MRVLTSEVFDGSRHRSLDIVDGLLLSSFGLPIRCKVLPLDQDVRNRWLRRVDS